MALKEDINIPLLACLGLLGTVILIVTILLTEAGFAKVRSKQLDQRYAEMESRGTLGATVYAKQLESIQQSRPANVSQTLFQIPIDKAKQAFIDQKGAVRITPQ
jgi:hypothetical protein